MCCFLTVLLFVGPRGADIVYWLLVPERWNAAFGSIIWPILGIIFLSLDDAGLCGHLEL